MQNEIWERFGSYLFSSDDEDRPVPSDYTFSFALEPQRRAVYEHNGHFYPSPPRFVNPWRVSKMVDDLSVDWRTLEIDNSDLTPTPAERLRAEIAELQEVREWELPRLRQGEQEVVDQWKRDRASKLNYAT